MSDDFTGGTVHCSGGELIHVSHAQRQWARESAQGPLQLLTTESPGSFQWQLKLF